MNDPSRIDPRVQKLLQGISETGIDLKPQGERSGKADRDRAANHIRKMRDLGYITPDEAIRRIDYINDSDVKPSLHAVSIDLPPMEPPKKKNPFRAKLGEWDWESREFYIPAMILLMVAAIVLGVVPGVLLSGLGRVGIAVGASCGAAGFVVFIATLIGLIWKLDKE